MANEVKETWVPIHIAFGKGPVPAASAKVIQEAIREMRRRGDLGSSAPLWQGLEYMAADYLAGFGKTVEEE